MNTEVINRIQNADWDQLYPILILFAQTRLKYALNTGGDPVIEGLDAKVLLDQAIDKTMDGIRIWDYEKITLETHLKGVIRSDVSSYFKKDIAGRVVAPVKTDEGFLSVVDTFEDHSYRPDVAVFSKETLTPKQKHLDAFEASISDDSELAEVWGAYEAGFTKPKEIAALTNLDPRRIDELKRKLLAKYLRFTEKYSGVLEKKDLIREHI